MPRRVRKLFSRKADADRTTKHPRVPSYLIPIPPPPPDYKKSIPRKITDKTGNMDTLDGKLARAEMAARRADALHRAAEVSAQYAKDLTKIARGAVDCADARGRALFPPYPEAPPPPYKETATPVRVARIGNRGVYTVDDVLEHARKASRDAEELKEEASEANVYATSLARTAYGEVTFAQRKVCYLLE